VAAADTIFVGRQFAIFARRRRLPNAHRFDFQRHLHGRRIMVRTEQSNHRQATLRRRVFSGLLAVAACLATASTASATGTDKTENLILATGLLDGRNEIIVCLDIVSGTLKGFVINTNSRQFFATYTAPSVAADLNVPKGRNPKYSLVTGTADFKTAGGAKLGTCVIYVAEESSGNMVAYACPWDSGAMSRASAKINVQFVKLGVVKVGAGGPAAGGAVEEGGEK
jgi:hypothetical protein